MFKTRIPPPVYLVLVAFMMWLLDRYVPVFIWLDAPWNYLGLALISVAILADLWSLALFFRAKTTPNPLHPERSKRLVISGLYRYTRNPMYLGMLIMLVGWWIYLGSLTPVVLLPLFVWVITKQQIEPEEAALSQTFGQAYRDYQQTVRRWL
ncbi:methyltransferase family protein [Thiolinea disciformis]|uniref:methyltransferase family protein n=1 Tax=Thiolinea disciformis TaxID=125614 RepID=UPI00038258BE|nr:isoprenylcysteine carboxylmethyltransferase family protein [Thiolinea disciformis]